MKRTHDLVASVGTYKDNQGNEKKRYHKCGSLFTDTDGRMSIKLDGVPVGNEWSGWISVFDADRDRGQQSQQPQRQPMRRDEFGDPVRNDDQIPGLEKGAVPRPKGQEVPF